MTLLEATTAAKVVSDHAEDDAEIIFGAIVDDDLGEEMRVTVIAAGFDKRRGRGPVRRAGAGAVAGDDGDLDIPSFVQG